VGGVSVPLRRDAMLEALRADHEPFDLLVIGGGATGAGVALDAVTRGLSVALVERSDLAAGTSSRSTKLIHGGVRYLEKAVKEFDRSQFALVRDALRERSVLIRNAPHLCHPLPLVTPLYNWLEVPYFMTGLKLYDALAGRANLAKSRFVDAREAKRRFPQLRDAGLRGGVVYYDGQFDDARMNLAIAVSAAERGAIVATHTPVVALQREGARLAGATVEDAFTGDRFEVAARVVVNAAGPYVDEVRRLADPDAAPMLSASSGVHVVLDARFAPPGTGLLIPQTEDGRVLFLLPWQGSTLVGTTDQPAEVVADPRASEAEIEYVLRHVRQYFSIPVERADVKAAWSGLRPLVSDPRASDTARLSRDHVVHVDEGHGMVSVAGGKWTTYRVMAADTVDAAVTAGALTPTAPSGTLDLRLAGAERFEATGAGALQERGLDTDVASHLHLSYGDRVWAVAALATSGFGGRLAPAYPYLEAEVVYGAREELVASSADVLLRRTRLGTIDGEAAAGALDAVHSLLADELGWDASRRARDLADARRALAAHRARPEAVAALRTSSAAEAPATLDAGRAHDL
jgi:glycerol-3-phosphate dehydrogenase